MFLRPLTMIMSVYENITEEIDYTIFHQNAVCCNIVQLLPNKLAPRSMGSEAGSTIASATK